MLWVTLEAEPAAETEQLYHAIRQGSASLRD
jgi:hypothetical protein